MEDGTIQVYYLGERIAFIELKQQQPKLAELRPAGPRVMLARKAKKENPWRQAYQNMRPRIPNQGNRNVTRWNAPYAVT